jgi:hypothetical protein
MADGKQWMSQNLSINAASSYCYGDAEVNCRRFGRLYTWQAAQQVCQSLGDGWRLLGGGRSGDGEYARLEAHGFYRTASAIDPVSAWSYNFGRGGQALHRQRGGEKNRAFSVRCVRD